MLVLLAAIPITAVSSGYYYQQQQASTSGQISNLNNQLTNQLSNISKQLNSSTAQLSSLSSQIDSLKAQISQLQSQLQKLNQTLNTQADELLKLNQTLTSKISQLEQALSESLMVNQPGAMSFTPQGFSINVSNIGAIKVNITSILIINFSPTGSAQCSGPSVCLLYPATSGTGFTNGVVGISENSHSINISGITINDGSGYKVILGSSLGKEYGFYYPWPVSNSPQGNGNGPFVINAGPLAIYFDYRSFNFTQGTQTQSQSAFCLPTSTSLILWVKIANTATDSSVTLKASTMMELQPYNANGFGQFTRVWLDDTSTINPSNVVAYNDSTNPYVLPAAGPNGPSSFTTAKFSASSQSGTSAASFGTSDNWITFIGFYYVYRGQVQGVTIPFIDLKTTSGFPGSC